MAKRRRKQPSESIQKIRLINELTRNGFRFSKPSLDYKLSTLKRNAARVRKNPIRGPRKLSGFAESGWDFASAGNYATILRRYVFPNVSRSLIGYVTVQLSDFRSASRPTPTDRIGLDWITTSDTLSFDRLASDFPDTKALTRYRRANYDAKGRALAYGLMFKRV